MFNFLSKNIFKTSWQLDLGNTIWKILPSNSKILICETRNVEKKTVNYYSINLENGKINWESTNINNNWWIGIEGIFGNVIFYHEYERPDFPIHKKIIATNLFDNSILWQSDNYRFIQASDEFVYVSTYNHENQIFLQLDIKTGKPIKNLDYEEIKKITSNEKLQLESLLLPISLPISDVRNFSIQKFFSSIKDKVNSEVDILDFDNYIILGYSIEKILGDKLAFNDYMSIINKKGKSLFKVQLIEGASQAISPRFFINNGYLIYVKNKTILNSIKLIDYENLH